MLIAAKEEDRDYRVFLRWISGYDQQLSFDKFKEALRPKIKSDKEIMQEQAEIFAMFEQNGLRKIDINAL